MGEVVPRASAESFHKRVTGAVSAPVWQVVEPLVEAVAGLTAKIRRCDAALEELSLTRYPETAALRQISGVGPITALAFVTTIEDPHRFARNRSVGAYLGLCPRRDQSGASDPSLRITKAGDPYLRRLLVGCAHYILGPFGADSDLRRWGGGLRGSRHEQQEASGGGGGAQARGALAQPVEERRDLRADPPRRRKER